MECFIYFLSKILRYTCQKEKHLVFLIKTVLVNDSDLDPQTSLTIFKGAEILFSLSPQFLTNKPASYTITGEQKRGTHPKVGAENMRVTSSHQKNALNALAK
jgi:hypothetical protein